MNDKEDKFDGFTINLYKDEDGDWLAHFVELANISNISAFGDTPEIALAQLKIAWEMVKEDYRASGEEIPISTSHKNYSNPI
jgi:predicted RNase H-like HicB family nuclease